MTPPARDDRAGRGAGPSGDGEVLRSSALGADLDELVRPCGDRRRPAEPTPPEPGPPIGLTFSGGGFRATFAALGVVRYLADCDLLGRVRYVSSVSGGSITNAMLATRWPALRRAGYDGASVDGEIIAPLADRVSATSLKAALIRNLWRTVGRTTRTDLLARALDDWFLHEVELESVDPECRWIVNAANLTTGARFAFERDVLGDYVVGLAETAGTGVRVSTAVAASAAVPGAFPPLRLGHVRFPCGASGPPALLDGGAYDNTGLEALDGDRYRDVFTITVNAGGVFVTGRYGSIPLVRDLARANSLLYRQSTGLRTRWMVDRFRGWPSTSSRPPPSWARRGLLFGLGTSFDREASSPELEEFTGTFPERRTYGGRDLAFVPTVFDRLDRRLLDVLVYRGWWLTGASFARWYPGMAPLRPGVVPPPAVPENRTFNKPG